MKKNTLDVLLILFIFITAQTIIIVLISNIIYTIIAVIIFIIASFIFFVEFERLNKNLEAVENE